MSNCDALIHDLVIANRILASEEVVDAYGHVTVRHPDNPNRFLIARSLAPELVGPEDIVELDLDGQPAATDADEAATMIAGGTISASRSNEGRPPPLSSGVTRISCGTDGLQTRRWSKGASNSRSHRERSGHGRAPHTNHRTLARERSLSFRHLSSTARGTGSSNPLCSSGELDETLNSFSPPRSQRNLYFTLCPGDVVRMGSPKALPKTSSMATRPTSTSPASLP